MPRGFANLSETDRIENARRAGIKAHLLGKAHRFTSEEAAEAGRVSAANKRQRKQDAAVQSAETK